MARLETLIQELEHSLRGACDCRDAVDRTSCLLKQFTSGSLPLPERLTQRDDGHYARHLVHQCRATGHTVVAMVWGPGQGTPVHDHAGTWCVEGCVSGKLEITNYRLLEELPDGRVRFRREEQMHVSPGAVGCLIPPFEHHTICNPFDQTAITLHVYGKEMTHCTRYLPEGEEGLYRVERVPLSYCSVPAAVN